MCPADRDTILRLDRIRRAAEDAEAARLKREAAEKAKRTTH
ncbi:MULTISPECIES: hypothetical protein [Streptomyces]|nr:MULTISPECIES: hypothetical protein [Streptomyces]MDI7791738.1 hypothetical protein [Streptomyces cavourensis]